MPSSPRLPQWLLRRRRATGVLALLGVLACTLLLLFIGLSGRQPPHSDVDGTGNSIKGSPSISQLLRQCAAELASMPPVYNVKFSESSPARVGYSSPSALSVLQGRFIEAGSSGSGWNLLWTFMPASSFSDTRPGKRRDEATVENQRPLCAVSSSKQIANHCLSVSGNCTIAGTKSAQACALNAGVRLNILDRRYVPETYALPRDLSLAARAVGSTFVASRDGSPEWIFKPDRGARGQGIALISSPLEIPTTERGVLQRLVASPFLIQGFKFHVRLYLIIIAQPFSAWLHSNALVLFASKSLGSNKRSLEAQLTNSAVHDENAQMSSAWTLKQLVKVVVDSHGRNVANRLKQDLKHLMQQIAGTARNLHHSTPSTACFDIYGVDVLIENNPQQNMLSPILLEVNNGPELYTPERPVNDAVHTDVVASVLCLTRFVPVTTSEAEAAVRDAGVAPHGPQADSRTWLLHVIDTQACPNVEPLNLEEA